MDVVLYTFIAFDDKLTRAIIMDRFVIWIKGAADKILDFLRKYYICEVLLSLILIFLLIAFSSSYSSTESYRNYKNLPVREAKFTSGTSYVMSFEAMEDDLGYIHIYINPDKSSLCSSDRVNVTIADDEGEVIGTVSAYLYNSAREYIKIDFGSVSLRAQERYYLTFSFDDMAEDSVLCLDAHYFSSFTEALEYSRTDDGEDGEDLSFDLAIGFSRIINVTYFYFSPDYIKAAVHIFFLGFLAGIPFIPLFRRNTKVREIYRAVASSIMIFLLGDVLNVMNRAPICFLLPLSVKHWFCLMLALLVICGLYFIFYAIFGKGSFAMLVTAVLFAILGFVNHTKLVMRGDSFVPWDILSAGIAVKTGSTYYFHITTNFVAGVLLCFSLICILIISDTPYRRFGSKRRLMIPMSIVAYMLVFFAGVLNTRLLDRLNVYYEVNPPIQSFNENGVYTAFVLHLNNIESAGSEDNSPAHTQELIYQYSGMASQFDLDSRINGGDISPNVICIMSESFADLRRIREMSVSEEVSPYYDSILNESIHGTAAVSVFGGGTCNSEFEFLTGNSMSNLIPGISVYSYYVTRENQAALPYIYRQNGYRTVALHSFDGGWWDRGEKYPLLGFDEFYTRDDFDETTQYVRRYISDMSTFRRITEIYESSEDPLFLFCVTMQNHGDYAVRYDDMRYDIKIEDITYADGSHFNYAENYLSLLRESDDALEYLIEYFRSVEEPTIIVFFGDHFPTLDSEFYSNLLQEDLGTVTVEQSLPIYETPYFIWANYDLGSGGTSIDTSFGDYGTTGLNFLGQTVLDLSGMRSPMERACLRVLQNNINAISSLAVYDLDNVAHTTNEELDDETLQLIDDYAAVQYGLLFYEEEPDAVSETDTGEG